MQKVNLKAILTQTALTLKFIILEAKTVLENL